MIGFKSTFFVLCVFILLHFVLLEKITFRFIRASHFVLPDLRLTANKCELCGKEGNVVSHHVRKLSDLRGKTEWERKMLKMHRKSLIVCAECHNMIHAENS